MIEKVLNYFVRIIYICNDVIQRKCFYWHVQIKCLNYLPKLNILLSCQTVYTSYAMFKFPLYGWIHNCTYKISDQCIKLDIYMAWIFSVTQNLQLSSLHIHRSSYAAVHKIGKVLENNVLSLINWENNIYYFNFGASNFILTWSSCSFY